MEKHHLRTHLQIFPSNRCYGIATIQASYFFAKSRWWKNCVTCVLFGVQVWTSLSPKSWQVQIELASFEYTSAWMPGLNVMDYIAFISIFKFNNDLQVTFRDTMFGYCVAGILVFAEFDFVCVQFYQFCVVYGVFDLHLQKMNIVTSINRVFAGCHAFCGGKKTLKATTITKTSCCTLKEFSVILATSFYGMNQKI